MTFVAGIDSSTQSCKVTIRDLDSGAEVREGKASHPSGTIVHPKVWWDAMLTAIARAGGLDDVVAVAVSAQQHTPVSLDEAGDVVCESPLWNDTSSHPHMVALNAEMGREEWIRRTGLPITLSDTVSKLRWLRDRDPESTRRTAAVAMVHDWLSWRLMGHGGDGALDQLTTDRSDACGTGYWSGATNAYDLELMEIAFGKRVHVPRVLGPLDRAGMTGVGIPGVPEGIPIGVGSGDNAAAALALGLEVGDGVLSLGTSGVIYARTLEPVEDLAGAVCNYSDATGVHLPLVATLNAARNFDVGTALLGCSYQELSLLALQADAGAGGLTLLPFFEGERTPDLPDARGSLHQASLTNFTRANFARAVIEGTLATQVAMIEALAAVGVHLKRLLLIGGAAQSVAVQLILSEMVDIPVVVPSLDEYVAKGAAMQAGAALNGTFPTWPVAQTQLAQRPVAHQILEQHTAAMVALGYVDDAAETVGQAPAATLTSSGTTSVSTHVS